MSPANMPHALEPGTRLVDRYRLEASLGSAAGTTYWRAQDELLDRPVGVCLLAGDSDAAQRVLSAARRAAAVSDARFLRVLDANEHDGFVYVVSEWVSASNLADLVAERPLSANQARELALEVAGALEAAHRERLSHLCLTPEHVLRTAHGQVKVAGLAVDAAVQGRSASDPVDAAARDTLGVVAVLYAALTGRWPGAEPTRVAPAPYDGDRVCSPRQVRAGVPDDLDGLVAQALGAGQHPGHHAGEPVTTPGELIARLTATATTSRIPVVQAHRERADDTPPPYAGGPYVARYDDEGGRGRLAGRAAYLLVGVVLLVGLGLVGWQLAGAGFGTGGGPGDRPSSTTSTTPAAQLQKLRIVSGGSLDPAPDGDGDENSDRADRAFDGDGATVWNTNIYRQQFGPGGLKDGVGLLLDLGSRKDVAEVALDLVGTGTDLEIRVADDQGGQLDDYTKVGAVQGAGTHAVVRLDRPTMARYVLVWLTRLPQADGGFRGQVAEVAVRG